VKINDGDSSEKKKKKKQIDPKSDLHVLCEASLPQMETEPFEAKFLTYFGKSFSEMKSDLIQYHNNKYYKDNNQNIQNYHWSHWWSFKFSLMKLAENQKDYWNSEGPKYRLKYLNSSPKEEVNADFLAMSSSYSEKSSIQLPKQDLEKCWQIMETAMYTRGTEEIQTIQDSFRYYFQMTNTFLGIAAAVALSFISIWLYANKPTDTLQRWSQVCPALYVPDNAVLTCSDTWNAGSDCWLTCNNGQHPIDKYGRRMPMLTECIGGSTWSNMFNDTRCDDTVQDYIVSSYGY